MLLSMAACQSGTATNKRNIDPCVILEPIRPSKYDSLTPGTERQILKYDLTGGRLCGWE